MIRLFRRLFFDFREIDDQIAKMRQLRDSYLEANRACYGDLIASLLES